MSEQWTDNPKFLRARQRQEEAFERAEREAEEALKKFYRENAQSAAREFLEAKSEIESGIRPKTPSILQKIYGSADGGVFGGVVGPDDE